jgi:hypothetical protein
MTPSRSPTSAAVTWNLVDQAEAVDQQVALAAVTFLAAS